MEMLILYIFLVYVFLRFFLRLCLQFDDVDENWRKRILSTCMRMRKLPLPGVAICSQYVIV